MNKTWVLVAAILGSSMSFIDASAVNVALPVIQRELGATIPQMQWVIEAYALFLSALILVGGSLGDVFGRRKLFAIGIAIFALASIACAAAPNIIALIIARSIQGIGGALAVPESLALISVTFTGDERGKAIGTWSGFASLTGAAGPVIGGFLAQTASWRWVFLINVPIAVLVLAIAILRVPESRDENASRTVDWSGGLLATIGLGALVYGLIRAATAQAGRVDGIALATIAVARDTGSVRDSRTPRERSDDAAEHVPVACVRRCESLHAGVVSRARRRALFLPVCADRRARLPAHRGRRNVSAVRDPAVRLLALVGRALSSLGRAHAARPRRDALAGCGFLLYSLPGVGSTNYWTSYFPAVLTLGIGAVFFIAPLTTIVFDSSDPALSGLASGINNAVARTAGLLAIALFGIVFTAIFANGFDRRMNAAQVSAQTRQLAAADTARFAGGTVPADVPPADRPVMTGVVKESYLDGFRGVQYASAAISFLAALVAFFFLPGRAQASREPKSWS